jgi:DNA polymerase V
MSKKFAIVDCNNFYVSCERVFDPSLRNKPVVVLSNNDGCIVARSNEVKNAGIPMGIPYFKVKDELTEINCVVLSSNYALYGDMSRRIMETLAEFTNNLEIYSIDEAFLSLDHINADALTDFGYQIKEIIYQNTGIPVSVGIAQTKTLAKLANEIAKKDGRKNNQYKGVINLYQNHNVDQYLKITPVGDIWGVGRKYNKLLEKNNLLNVYDLIQTSDLWIKKHLTIQGLRMVKELRGIPCLDLETVLDPKKGIISSRSFSKKIERLLELQEAVATHASRIGEKLRKQNSVAGEIYVFLMANRFKTDSYYKSLSLKLPTQTNYTPELIKHALIVLDKIYKKGLLYQKAGVMSYNISSDKSIQLNLFDTPNPAFQRQEKIMQVLDKLNQKYGKNTLKLATLGMKQAWQMRSQMRSPRYTTVWNELLKVV